MNAEQLLKQGKQSLLAANRRFGCRGGEEDEAWELLAHTMGREPELEEEVPTRLERRFQRLLDRRAQGEPLAFITGWVAFRDLRLQIKPGMFIPRYTSEFQAEQAIRRLRRRQQPVHVDLATGIGPVALASASSVPHARVWGLDISQKAINQARANATRLGLDNASFRRSDLLAALPEELGGAVDVITIHPPYVPNGDVADLPIEIKKFEPRHTLTDGSPDGLGLASRTVEEGRSWLRPGGWLLIEVMPSLANLIRALMRQNGYRDIKSTHGELRLTRVVVGRR